MAVEVLRAINVAVPNNSSPSVFVVFELLHPRAQPQTFSTPILSATPDAAFRSVTQFAIDRKPATIHAFKNTKKIVKVRLMLRRSFILSDVCLGVAETTLADLATTSVVHQFLDLHVPDAVRKTTGSKIEFRVRLRRPLESREMVTVHRRIATLDLFRESPEYQRIGPAPGTAVASAAPTVQTAPQKSVAAANVSVPRASAAKPKAAASAVPAPLQTPQPPAMQTEKVADWIDDDPVENMRSYQLVTWEIGHAEEQIKALQGRGAPVPEGLSERLEEARLRQQLIQTEGELGQITGEEYLARLKADSAAYKATAVAAHKHGDRDKGIRLLRKAKIIEAEIASLTGGAS
eukprot:TRINITY_DN9351_c0_g1_i3.p2 TRINITY_DN9351_c0_g1~~TRINITY_DN9351_c0_g1_i3.p2  ORF type:complete len:348 (-),score=78.94 TRINITY_DN9351_c0_g1_i3:63-1106(-)